MGHNYILKNIYYTLGQNLLLQSNHKRLTFRLKFSKCYIFERLNTRIFKILYNSSQPFVPNESFHVRMPFMYTMLQYCFQNFLTSCLGQLKKKQNATCEIACLSHCATQYGVPCPAVLVHVIIFSVGFTWFP